MAHCDWLCITCICLAFLVISLHSFGIYVLIKTNLNLAENIEIFSLSISLLSLSVYQTIRIVMEIEYPNYEKYFYGITAAFFIPMYSSMILLTLQRFFAIWLHLRYESTWVFLKRTHMVAASWIAFVLFFIVSLALNLTETLTVKIVSQWTATAGVLLTNVVFVSIYIYIYIKYRHATQITRDSLYRNRKTKFFTPFIICASFFIFGTMPHMFRAVVETAGFRYHFVWFCLDGISDSIVYIFMNENFMRCFRRWKNRNGVAIV
eukprot:TCONS_00057414-protein